MARVARGAPAGTSALDTSSKRPSDASPLRNGARPCARMTLSKAVAKGAAKPRVLRARTPIGSQRVETPRNTASWTKPSESCPRSEDDRDRRQRSITPTTGRQPVTPRHHAACVASSPNPTRLRTPRVVGFGKEEPREVVRVQLAPRARPDCGPGHGARLPRVDRAQASGTPTRLQRPKVGGAIGSGSPPNTPRSSTAVGAWRDPVVVSQKPMTGTFGRCVSPDFGCPDRSSVTPPRVRALANRDTQESDRFNKGVLSPSTSRGGLDMCSGRRCGADQEHPTELSLLVASSKVPPSCSTTCDSMDDESSRQDLSWPTRSPNGSIHSASDQECHVGTVSTSDPAASFGSETSLEAVVASRGAHARMPTPKAMGSPTPQSPALPFDECVRLSAHSPHSSSTVSITPNWARSSSSDVCSDTGTGTDEHVFPPCSVFDEELPQERSHLMLDPAESRQHAPRSFLSPAPTAGSQARWPEIQSRKGDSPRLQLLQTRSEVSPVEQTAEVASFSPPSTRSRLRSAHDNSEKEVEWLQRQNEVLLKIIEQQRHQLTLREQLGNVDQLQLKCNEILSAVNMGGVAMSRAVQKGSGMWPDARCDDIRG